MAGRTPDSAERIRRPRFDIAGAALLGLGLAGLLYGISEGPHAGWTSWQILACLAASAALLVSWAIVELRTRSSLVRFSVLRHGDVNAGVRARRSSRAGAHADQALPGQGAGPHSSTTRA